MRSTTLAFSAVACLAALAAPTDAAAKAAYRSLADTVRTAEIIAIVEVEPVVSAELHGEHWEYAHQVTARPLQVLAGEVDGPAAEVPAAEVPAAESPANPEPMECGYAASHRDAQTRRFGGPPLWIAAWRAFS